MTATATMPRTMTITEAAAATGLPKKSIRNRVDRGSLQHVTRDGLRRIPMSELIRAGLLGLDGEALEEAENRAEPHRGGSAGGTLGIDVGALIIRLEEQATELGRLRALQEAAQATTLQADARADRLQEELLEAATTISSTEATVVALEEQLEQQQARRRWFRR